jgi:hypothetical protein
MIWFPAAALVILVVGFTFIMREIEANDRRHREINDFLARKTCRDLQIPQP